jgi:hypothetical protein
MTIWLRGKEVVRRNQVSFVKAERPLAGHVEMAWPALIQAARRGTIPAGCSGGLVVGILM